MLARVNVYVDGLNLYYGVARNTRYRWLNLRRLSEGLVRRGNEIRRIRYFTARVTDHEASVRQAAYLRALATIPHLTIHEGHFRTYQTSMPRTDGGGMAAVYRTEEKGSDVNLASHACDGDFETALVISNDTDLVFPLREVRHRLGVTVGVACPVYHRDRVPSQELVDAADFRAHITRRHRKLLRESQFPDPVIDAAGREIRKPAAW